MARDQRCKMNDISATAQLDRLVMATPSPAPSSQSGSDYFEHF